MITRLLANLIFVSKPEVSLRLLNVTTVAEDFDRIIRPQRGQSAIRFRVDFEVIGHRSASFAISADFNGREIVQEVGSHEPGRHTRIYTFGMPIESNLPVTITLDPNQTSGDRDLADNKFQSPLAIEVNPQMPAVLRSDPRVYDLKETLTLGFEASAAGQDVTIGMASLRETATVQPSEPSEATAPDYVVMTGKVNALGKIAFEREHRVTLWNVTVNPDKLAKITWSQVDKDDRERQFLTMSAHLDVKSPQVSSFVAAALGKDHRLTLSPFECAKRLFKAVKAKIKFAVTDCFVPSKIIDAGIGQCASGNRLYCAALRSIGIPARTVGGFYEPGSKGGHDGHRITEFYLSGAGWIPADATPDAKPVKGGHLDQFANTNQTNRLWTTYADDAVYPCGYALGTLISGSGVTDRSEQSYLIEVGKG